MIDYVHRLDLATLFITYNIRTGSFSKPPVAVVDDNVTWFTQMSSAFSIFHTVVR